MSMDFLSTMEELKGAVRHPGHSVELATLDYAQYFEIVYLIVTIDVFLIL